MITKRYNLKVFNVIAVFILAAVLLTACGSFSFQAQSAPAEDGGIGISGGVDAIQPGSDSAGPAPAGQMMNPAVILLLVGFGVLVLILLLLVQRRSSDKQSS